MAEDLTSPGDDTSWLRPTEELFRRMVESVEEYAIFALDHERRITAWNTGAQRIFEYEEQEILGKSSDVLFTPEDRAAGIPRKEQLDAERSGRAEDERWHMKKTGERFYASGIMSPIQDDRGNVYGYTKVCRDLTDQKRQAEALERSEQENRVLLHSVRLKEARLQMAVTLARLGTFDIDLQTDAVEVNDPGRKIYGWAPDTSVTFKDVQAHFHPEDRDKVLEAVHSAFDPASSGWFEVEQRIIRIDGEIRWIRVIGQAFFEGEGPHRHAVRCLGTYTDVTRIKESEAQQRQINQRKDEFLAMLAHELRNPLFAIRSALDVSSGARDTESFAWARGVMERQTAQLTHLVDDLLDVSRITGGKIQLRKSVIDIAPVIDEAVESVLSQISAKRHELILQYEAGELFAEADSRRLQQIVVNLLTNAVRYTPSGGRVWLSAYREQDQAVISIRDNGSGIAPDKLPEMFELFTQGDREMARTEGGLGLGLTIVKALTELHGGEVTAHSDGRGSGSEFIIRLPVTIAAPDQSDPEESGGQKVTQVCQGARVLIVDDNADTAHGLRRLLERDEHTIRIAHDGRSALDIAYEFEPQVVLLDLGLPVMNGYEVVKELRNDDRTRHATCVAISGYGQEEDRRRCMESGFDHHFVKPADLTALRQLIADATA